MAKSIGLDVVAIIKVCAENGVQTFKSGSLEINFGGWPIQKTKHPIQSIEGGVSSIDVSSDEQKPAKSDTDMDELLIENPLAYEEALEKASNN